MSKALLPIEQKQVLFYDDEVTAVRMDNGSIYVPIRPLCDYLGVSWQGQHRRIMDDAVLSDTVMSVNITLMDIVASNHSHQYPILWA